MSLSVVQDYASTLRSAHAQRVRKNDDH